MQTPAAVDLVGSAARPRLAHCDVSPASCSYALLECRLTQRVPTARPTLPGCAPVTGGSVSSVAYSLDGRMIASVGHTDRTIKLWRASDYTLIRTLYAPKEYAFGVSSVAFSPDGALLAAGFEHDTEGLHNTFELWSTADGTRLHVLVGHTWTVSSVAFSPDGKTVASRPRGFPSGRAHQTLEPFRESLAGRRVRALAVNLLQIPHRGR